MIPCDLDQERSLRSGCGRARGAGSAGYGPYSGNSGAGRGIGAGSKDGMWKGDPAEKQGKGNGRGTARGATFNGDGYKDE